MLELRNIKKDYPMGEETVHALKGIDLRFRKSEFVSVLGQSGCGKTTMLNIIGGLDGYTDGDLIINGVSTKKYKDRDWDSYRNHSIGFVFQSYNLIPHQTVLQNVELALSLSGVSKKERKQRAKDALKKVGLESQYNKKPCEMSGGQMQRVAIARAIVNDPDIILADEPTGALDTETSVQVMEILKEISKEKLVIMVTHNPELAEKYSTRIIRMLDGVIIGDSMPVSDDEITAYEQKKDEKHSREKKPSLSLATSFALSLNNLFTKKGRTALTSFAGSIGIIGIALILAVSQGTTAYIDHVQETTLSAYPLTLESQTLDMSAMIESFMSNSAGSEHENDAIYKDMIIADLVNALSKLQTSENDLKAFKSHIEKELENKDSELYQAINGIQYTYAIEPTIYTKNVDGNIIKSDMNELMMEMIGDFMMQVGVNNNENSSSQSSYMGNPMMSTMMGLQMWQELLPGIEDGDHINAVIEDQYQLIHGQWPDEKNEIVLIVNENNELDDLTLYALGLLSKTEIDAIIDAAANGEEMSNAEQKWSYEDVCGRTFKAVMPYDCYKKYDDIFIDVSKNENMLKMLYEDAIELKISGIVRPNEDADVQMLSGTIGYTHLLTEYVIEQAKNSEVVKAQLSDPMRDVLTGLPFEANTGRLTPEQKESSFREYLSGLDTAGKAEAFLAIQCLDAEQKQLDAQVEAILATMQDKDAIIAQISESVATQMGISGEQVSEMLSGLSIEELKEMLRSGVEEQVKAAIAQQVRQAFENVPAEQIADMLDAASAGYTTEQCALYYDEITEFSNSTYDENLITIGCVDLEKPQTINLYASSFENKDVIVDAISSYNESVEESKQIAYTDFLGIMMSSITTVINAITYVLIAFVAISLIVSSIMIGVITLISVQERTKEIGILRAIGASKRNVSNMFNAETVIIGFISGFLGVMITYLLCIPINLILHAVTGIQTLSAQLPVPAALILIAISVLLTLFSGIIPSRSAAKKDPVVALRTE